MCDRSRVPASNPVKMEKPPERAAFPGNLPYIYFSVAR